MVFGNTWFLANEKNNLKRRELDKTTFEALKGQRVYLTRLCETLSNIAIVFGRSVLSVVKYRSKTLQLPKREEA